MGKGLEIATVYRNEDIVSRVHDFLLKQHVPSREKLEFSIADGTLTVRGRAESFYEKQIVMSTCLRVPGVVRFIDHISVGP